MAAKDKNTDPAQPDPEDSPADVPTADDKEISKEIDAIPESAADAGLTNSPEVEHRLAEVGENDANAETRKAMKEGVQSTLDDMKARVDRAEALMAPVQKVTDGNETAALQTITGLRPVRDLSDAPPPAELGPHHESTEKA